MWTSVLSKPDVQNVYAFPPALFANRELADPKFIPRLLMTKGRAEPTYAHLFPLSKKPGSNTMVLVKKNIPLTLLQKGSKSYTMGLLSLSPSPNTDQIVPRHPPLLQILRAPKYGPLAVFPQKQSQTSYVHLLVPSPKLSRTVTCGEDPSLTSNNSL